jgi:hypothetical protein
MTGVLLGVHPQPALETTLTGEAQTLVTAKDFHLEGGVRRAYAEVYVSGITEPVEGYIVPKVVDVVSISDDRPYTYITNVRGSHNAPYVVLYPSSEPTYLDGPVVSEDSYRVKVAREEGGVRLSGLQAGEEVRVFNAKGIAVAIQKAEGSTIFLPLSAHGVHVLSVTGEVYKFQY